MRDVVDLLVEVICVGLCVAMWAIAISGFWHSIPTGVFASVLTAVVTGSVLFGLHETRR